MDSLKQSELAIAQELIEYLITNRSEKGWALVSKTEIALRELSSLVSNDTNTKRTTDVLGWMYENDKNDFKSFKDKFEEISLSEQLKPDKSWKCYLPFIVTYADEILVPKNILVQDQEIVLKGFHTVNDELSIDLNFNDQLGKAFGVKTNRIITDTFITTEINAKSTNEAWKKIESILDTFIGFVEFEGSFGISEYGNIKPRALVSYPAWIIFMQDRDCIGMDFEVQDFLPGKPFNSINAVLDKMQFSETIISHAYPHNSISSLIADSFRLYSQALNEPFKDGCFLGLWQILENISRSENFGGDTKTVRDRIVWHGDDMDLVGTGFKYLLNVLSKKRNSIVHRGMKLITDEDVNSLKFIVDYSLAWLINSSQKVKTKHHLDHLYRYRTENDHSLNALNDIITLLINNEI